MLPSRLFNDNFLEEFTSFKGMECDIYEKDNEYHIEMDVPGYKKEEIKIDCHKGTLTIKAEKKELIEEKDETKKYIRKERKYGKIERSFYLGDIEEENIHAKYNNGSLEIIIPIKKEVERKTINID